MGFSKFWSTLVLTLPDETMLPFNGRIKRVTPGLNVIVRDTAIVMVTNTLIGVFLGRIGVLVGTLGYPVLARYTRRSLRNGAVINLSIRVVAIQ